MTPRRPGSSRPCRTLARTLVIALLLQGNWGCSAFRQPDPPATQKLTIRGAVERDKHGQVDGDLEAYSTLKGVLVGTVAGVPTGGFTGGSIAIGPAFIGCGTTAFLWPLCVFFATVTGAVLGAIVGLVGGGVMGFVGGLPSKTAKEITADLADIEKGRRFEDDFAAAVRQAVPMERHADETDAAATVLTARLEEFDLRQHSKDRISVRLRASMIQTWHDEKGKQRKNRCKYLYDSERQPAESWLEGGTAAFGEAVTKGLETFASWMNRDLEAFRDQTELPKSEVEPRSCYRAPRWYRWY